MSKFGAHITLGRRDGIGAALASCYNAGSPIPLLFCVDQNLRDDIRKYSPTTLFVFRTQIDGDDNPPSGYTGDPVAVAEAWYSRCAQKWLLNDADYFAFSNERDTQTVEHRQWCNAFDLRMMQLADADGFKLALHGDSQGEPRLDYLDDYLSSLQYASQHGHILHLHEAANGAGNALRYRDVHRITAAYAPALKIIISECYGDNLGDWPAYVDSFKPYDLESMSDPYLLGLAAYQLGGDENWFTEIPRWAEWVMTHPTPSEPPPVIDRVFDHWEDNGVEVSRENPFYFTATEPRVLTAITIPKPPPVKQVFIEVQSDGFGQVTGRGLYNIGATVAAEWLP